MDIQNYNFWASLRINLSVISVPVQLPAPPGFLTHSGCGYNTVSCTEIDRRVLRCQAAELHVGCAGGCVYSQCGLALEHLIVVSTTTCRKNLSNPLKALSRPLLHPVHPVGEEGIARSLAGDLDCLSRLLQLRSRLHQLDLCLDTCEKNTGRWVFMELLQFPLELFFLMSYFGQLPSGIASSTANPWCLRLGLNGALRLTGHSLAGMWSEPQISTLKSSLDLHMSGLL